MFHHKLFYCLCFFMTLWVGQTLHAQVDHSTWGKLLEENIKNGKVDYTGFIASKADFEEYLNLLSTNPPQDSWSKNERLAYWINAYNAFTVKLIIDNYPLKSIQDLHPFIKIPGIRTVWHQEFFEIGGEPESLNDIEHEILRKKFEEPRIHFAINCASISCPDLRAEAYTASKIEQQLAEQTRLFINDTSKNKLSKDKAELSKIFNWFSKDFTQQGSLLQFINQYSNTQVSEKATVDYLDYDWNLNE